MNRLLYLLFFCSGLSGLIYQVVWVRVFGNVFGNTIYSASLVIAVFMLGLGIGSYAVGVWADRRYTSSLSGVEAGLTASAKGYGGPPKQGEDGNVTRRRKTRLYRPRESMVRAYGYFELLIAAMGLGVSALLPDLDRISALVSSYSRDANGWYVLSTTSYVARAAIAVALLTPITLLMGGTLTLLIRHLVRDDPDVTGWRIAVLYGVNTAGAALGCFLTDFALVPALGLRETQMVAVFFNAIAAVGALWLAGSPAWHPRWGALAGSPTRHPRWGALVRRAKGRLKPDATADTKALASRAKVRLKPDTTATTGSSQTAVGGVRLQADQGGNSRTDVGGVRLQPDQNRAAVALTSLALALSGFAAMGMEIVWFRHFSILLGGFRAVFSLLLTVILIGIGAGSLVSSYLQRYPARLRSVELRRGSGEPSAQAARPAQWLMAVQGFFIACTLPGLVIADPRHIDADVIADPAYRAAAGRAVEATLNVGSGLAGSLAELWFNARPILLEVALPALLMGFSFPLANAIVQHAERSVGRRAGVLYLSNTVGAVCGSLAAGFLLLPLLGIQSSATVLMTAAALAIVPLYFATRSAPLAQYPSRFHAPTAALAGSLVVAVGALSIWVLLPSDYLITRALASSMGMPNERLLTRREGLNEVIAVTEVPGKGRRLLTNGHPMSATLPLSQRYMRALAHIPLLSMDNPEAVLVIGFGVGNTTHAATLHPSVRRVEVADLSRDILAHSRYFSDINKDVLNDPRVLVYVNDGRHHLQMQPRGSYDLITLEPPPIGYAGVAALYSKEFYALARTHLRPKAYISQWLPAYQVPTATTLAMIRAFVDVFPQAVLLSGAEADLLLVGTNDSRIEIDPARLGTALSKAPAVQADLQRLDLGSVREIVGTFVGSAEKLAEATRDSAPVGDDRPIQEYGVSSLLNLGEAVPASVVDLSRVTTWCPKCFVDGKPVPLAEGLDTYLALLELGYRASPAEIGRARSLAERQGRTVAGSAYLGQIVPESAGVHNLLGIRLAGEGQFAEAITEFREALRLDPDSAGTHWNLGAALASRGAREEAIEHLRRSVQLDPNNAQVHYDLATTLFDAHQVDDAIGELRATLRLMPNSAEAHNNLGTALASQGKLDEAIDHFQQAQRLDPEFADARRNLTEAVRQRAGASEK